MRESKVRLWWGGICSAQPIMIGYLPVAVMFGISSRTAGFGPFETVLMSVLIFAGASQFALVGMLASGVSFSAALLATVGLNLRHLFYGPAIAPHIGMKSWKHALLIAFGLTDEVFASAIANLPSRNEADRCIWMIGLESGSYLAWLLGTWIGALGFQMVSNLIPTLVPVLSFSLPSLFLVILMPLLKGDAALSALVAAAVSATLILSGFSTAGLVAGGLAGAAVGVFGGRADD